MPRVGIEFLVLAAAAVGGLRRKAIAWAAVLLALVFVLASGHAHAYVGALPGGGHRVTDEAGVLGGVEFRRLASQLQALERRTGAQVQVLVVQSLDGEPIERFTQRVFDAWRPGRAEVDDGVLIVLAKQERLVRIQPGVGLSEVLTPARARQIISSQMAPAFREERFAAGFEAAVNEISRDVQAAAAQRATPLDSSRLAVVGEPKLPLDVAAAAAAVTPRRAEPPASVAGRQSDAASGGMDDGVLKMLGLMAATAALMVFLVFWEIFGGWFGSNKGADDDKAADSPQVASRRLREYAAQARAAIPPSQMPMSALLQMPLTDSVSDGVSTSRARRRYVPSDSPSERTTNDGDSGGAAQAMATVAAGAVVYETVSRPSGGGGGDGPSFGGSDANTFSAGGGVADMGGGTGGY